MSAIPVPYTAEHDLAAAVAPRLVTDLPGPNTRKLLARDAAVTSPSMGRVYPLAPRRASGLVIEDVDGNHFLDFNAGIAVNSTGHCHPEVVAAIERQSHELLHYCSSDFYLPSYVELCERLVACAPMDGPAKVFLGNSGTEAVEAAIKLARHATGRPNVVAFLGSFHGRSMGSLSLTASKSKYRGGFGVMLPGTYHAPYGEAGYIDRVIFKHLSPPEDVAAIIVEPIQGEGGYLVPPEGWLAELRDVCDEHGILLVADEVQSGIGRTGKMWAIEHDGVQPDVLLSGKGLASGLPLSAVIARDEVMSWGPGKHGSTFGGNPVACAAAIATLDLVERGLAANSQTVGAHLMDRLHEVQSRHPDTVKHVRGRGLMIGVELPTHDDAIAVEQACFRRGLLVLTAGESSLRLAPPLVVTVEQADVGVAILESVLGDLAGR